MFRHEQLIPSEMNENAGHGTVSLYTFKHMKTYLSLQ